MPTNSAVRACRLFLPSPSPENVRAFSRFASLARSQSSQIIPDLETRGHAAVAGTSFRSVDECVLLRGFPPTSSRQRAAARPRSRPDGQQRTGAAMSATAHAAPAAQKAPKMRQTRPFGSCLHCVACMDFRDYGAREFCCWRLCRRLQCARARPRDFQVVTHGAQSSLPVAARPRPPSLRRRCHWSDASGEAPGLVRSGGWRRV